VASIGGASFLADLGHEIPTALLPSLLTNTLHAPASALGLIEGISDATAGLARLAGGALADDPGRRRNVAVGGYTSTAVLSAGLSVVAAPWQAGLLRAGAWGARGLRVPARNALLADIVPPAVYGRAYGFERAMDNLGAIGGPLLAIGLVGLVGVRSAIALSVIPGLLAAVAIVYAIRHTATPRRREHQPIRLRVRPVLHGRLGRIMIGVTAFELGNCAATLLILRATDLFDQGHTTTKATQLALILYVLYNVAATLISIPAGRHGDRSNPIRVMAAGAVSFGAGYVWFAVGSHNPIVLAPAFILAGSASAVQKRLRVRRSPAWPRPTCEDLPSVSSPPPRPAPTSWRAPSPASCGPRCLRRQRSCSSLLRWPSPCRSSLQAAAAAPSTTRSDDGQPSADGLRHSGALNNQPVTGHRGGSHIRVPRGPPGSCLARSTAWATLAAAVSGARSVGVVRSAP